MKNSNYSNVDNRKTQEFNYSELDRETRTMIEQCACEIKKCLGQQLKNIYEVGCNLCKVKESLKHGKFGSWLKKEFDWSHDTANRYMNVALYFAKYIDQISHGAEFQQGALYYLASDSIPDEVRDKAIEQAMRGEKITLTKARKLGYPYKNSHRSSEHKSRQPKQPTSGSVACSNEDQPPNRDETEVSEEKDDVEKPNIGGTSPETSPKVDENTSSNKELAQQKVTEEEKLATDKVSTSRVPQTKQLQILTNKPEEQEKNSSGVISMKLPEKTDQSSASPHKTEPAILRQEGLIEEVANELTQLTPEQIVKMIETAVNMGLKENQLFALCEVAQQTLNNRQQIDQQEARNDRTAGFIGAAVK